jgi:hypothetical protein
MEPPDPVPTNSNLIVNVPSDDVWMVVSWNVPAAEVSLPPPWLPTSAHDPESETTPVAVHPAGGPNGTLR